MSNKKDLETIVHIEDKILGVGAYEDRFDFTPLSYDSSTLSCSMEHYVLINKDTPNEERIDFGKAFRAIDYAEAYIEQNGVPKYKVLNIEPVEYIAGITPGFVKLNVSMAYCDTCHIDTLRFDFKSTAEREFFIEKLQEAHNAHIENDELFHYSMINTIYSNVKKSFAEEPIAELENL